MAKNKRKKVDFNLATEVFQDASLTDSFQMKPEISKTVEISKLITNPYQPRISIEKSTIEELAHSIEENGLLQPITVLENSNETYTIVFGHRRVAAYSFLDKDFIEANILTSLDNKDLVISPIVENLQRKDMEPIETAMALNRVLKMGIIKTQNDLANSLGISQGRVSKLLSILKLSNDVLSEVNKESYKDVTVLAAINKIELEKQLELFNIIKFLPRDEALLQIKKFQLDENIIVKRVVHSNNHIKINTKGVSKDIKNKINSYIQNIEKLLDDEDSNNE